MSRLPLLPSLLLVPALAGCGAAPVSFACADGEPLCDFVEVMSDERAPAKGVDLVKVAIYQGNQLVVMEDGEDVVDDDGARLVEGRDALIRLWVQPHEGFEERNVTGRAWLYRNGELFAAFQADLEATEASIDGDQETTVNIYVSGLVMLDEVELKVELVEHGTSPTTGGEKGAWAWPADGRYTMEMDPLLGPIRVRLVPIQYDADGSGRIPDTSEETIETLREYMWKMYPATEVEIAVDDVMATSVDITPGSTDTWSQLLTQVADLRNSRLVADDEYLYGMFEPDTTLSEFCAGGCIAGISNLAYSATDTWSRASIGLGFDPDSAGLTMVHEVGHAHGRSHSPGCGAAGSDPDYPNAQGYLDGAGWDLAGGIYKDPDSTFDFMSYCGPYWVSAFTFDALALRVREVNQLYWAATARSDWHAVWVLADGSLRWGADRNLPAPPTGQPRTVDLLDAHGASLGTVDAVFQPFADIGGGALVFPATDLPVVRVRVDGQTTGPRVAGPAPASRP